MKRGSEMNAKQVDMTTKQGGEDYKLAVKRRKGVPKSANKNLHYSRKFNGVEDIVLARAINKFETKHKRVACIDDILGIFEHLQVDEPHGEIIICEDIRTQSNNYYSVLNVEVLSYHDQPIMVEDVKFYKHFRRAKYVKKSHGLTFDEIIKEHQTLMSVKEHNKVLSHYDVPHSLIFSAVSESEPIPQSKVDPPESGDSSSLYADFIRNYSDLQPILENIRKVVPNSDLYLDIFEDLIFISYIITYCDDPNILFGTLITIYKKHTKGSISSSIYKLVNKLCFSRPKQEPQSLDFKVYVNRLMSLKNSVLFSKITEGLSICIAFGFINPINITVQNIKLFTCKASQIGQDSQDFVSYVIDLLLYFFDIGHQLFQGNFERLFDMNELSKIDDDLLHLRTYLPSIQIGSYELETKYTIEHYHSRLIDTIESLKMLSSSIKDRTYRSLIQSKLTNAYQLLVLFDQSKPLAGLRESPFSISFFGESSVGKSSCAKMILTNILQFNDKISADSHICTIQPTDKFYSTYKANTTGVIIDDLCNTRHEKAAVDPAQLLISIINNIPYYAPKAEAHEKGKINVRPSVVVTTSNVENLEAHIWSNEPISVVRRMKFHIEVKVRPEFTTNRGLDSSKVTDEQIINLKENGIQDLWLFNVRYVERFYKGSAEQWKFSTVKCGNKLLENIDIYELLSFLNSQSREHFAEQRNFVDLCKDSGLRHKNCKVCCYPSCKCICTKPDDSVQGSLFSIIDSYCEYLGKRAADYVLYSWCKILPGYLETALASPVLKIAVLGYMKRNYLNVINYIPYSVRETEFYKSLHYYAHRHKLYRNMAICGFVMFFPCWYYADLRRPWEKERILGLGLLSTVTIYRHTYCNIMRDLKEAPLNTIVPHIQNHHAISKIFKFGVSISVAVVALRTFRSFYIAIRGNFKDKAIKEDLKPDDGLHGNLTPESYGNIQDRDAEVNCWAKTTEKFTRNPNTLTMTSSDLMNVIRPNILNMVMMTDDFTGVSIGCIALKSNVFCCPLHFFKKDKNIFGPWRTSNVKPATKESASLYKLRLIKHDGESGNYFSATLDYNDIVQIDKLDLCVFKLYSGGSLPDILKYCHFMEDSSPTLTIKRTRNGNLVEGCAFAVHCPASYSVPGVFFPRTFDIQGGRATYDISTTCGDCMMVHVRNTVSPSIVGFHISGTTGTKKGSYTMFTKDQINTALDKLDNIHKIFTPHAGSFLNMNRLGTLIKVEDTIPDRAPVNYIQDHNYIIRGNLDTQVSYFTDIKPTFMCSKVERIFGVDNIYAGPKFGPQKYKPWYTFLSSSAHNDNLMDSSLLKLAMDDYIAPLKVALAIYDEHERIEPLTHNQIINGIPGKRFIDHINFNSSIGYPLKGKKIKYMEGRPTEYDFADKEIFQLEFDYMKSCYLRGERYYPIFKASLKDEPIPKVKDKVRVFQAADITLQYGWRKYGLPILRFLSMHPILSECAVGVNPYSDEWDQLHQHLTFRGEFEDRIVAGDYKSWDQKLPSQLVMAAFEIIVRIAKIIPTYSPDDILIIQGLATDTTYYLSHFNGTLIEFNNGLPSGHNLTAHINSIANSLLLRYGYYLYKNPAPFREYCHAITYGDDFETGVHNSVKNFDHIKYKSVVEKLGMLLTMPDKTSNPVPFLNIDNCDFLKRRGVKCSLDNLYYGALDYNSMVRSLLVRGKTSVSEREHAHSVIRGFIHDLSFHPKEFYNDKILLVRELLNEINLIIPESSFDYEGYYHYRNRHLSWWQQDNLDTLNSATTPVGYPMTPEASGDSDFNEYYVSSISKTTIDECDMDISQPLTETETINSYSSTKVLGECEARSSHDDCIQSAVFGESEDNLESNVVQTGTTVLTSSAEHSMQALTLTSSDLLSLRQHESRDLKYYLSRPKKIYTIYPLSNTIPLSFEPLWLFLNANLIRDKIRNYAYINAVLHVRVVVIGSPTMAGAQLLALHPWHKKDNGLGKLNFNEPLPNITQMSQLPSIVTDLSREKGGEISLPIICPTNGLDITSVDQIKQSFNMHYYPLTTARTPLGSNIEPQLVVYAWLSDVKLTGTSLVAELPQSDEYCIPNEKQPSSDYVSIKEAVSSSAGKVMGKATEIGVNAMMSAMGFSNPNSQDGVVPHVPRLLGNMSTYNGPCNIDSLGGDYKNEVSLDTKHLGYEDPDHMNLNNILTRWSMVDILTVPTGVIGGPSPVYALPVNPLSCFEELGSTTVYTPTALGMAALPFNRWRGAITYRFQAVGTAFMKGKIKISHDVKFPSVVTDSQAQDTQVLNSVIWDLASTNILEVKVPWASNRPFKSCGLLRRAVQLAGVNGELVPNSDSNGVLLLNPYSAINDNGESGIAIIVSIKGEKGMAFGDMRAVLANYTFAGIDNTLSDLPQAEEFALIDPNDIDYNLSNEYVLHFKNGDVKFIDSIVWIKYFANAQLLGSMTPDDLVQSLVYDNSLNSNVLTGDSPGSILSVNINGLEDNLEDHDDMVMTCMGEKWFSVRQIIKRYTQNWTRNIVNSSQQETYYRIRLPDRPLVKGWQGLASVNVQPNGIPVTFARDSFLSFYSMAYLGYRGSIRHKLVVKTSHNATSSADQPMVSVSRSGPGYIEERVLINATSNALTTPVISYSASSIPALPDARAGMTLGYSHINPILEYSTPYYSSGKFCWAQDRYPQVAKATLDGGYDVPWHQIIVHQYTNVNGARIRIDKFVAAGDDFSLFFYLYGPRMVLNQPVSYPQT